MAELTAPVVFKQDEKRIVFGPVLVPNEPDTDGDVVSPEKIEEVAHLFLEKYGNIDLMHTLNNVGRVVESYILPFDWEIGEYVIPKGSWMMGVKVLDDETWKLVKQGKLTGFSIMGVSKVKSIKSKKKAQAQKRTTLADLERHGDWIVNAVSLVDSPAVPKAKFIAIKSKNKIASVEDEGPAEGSAKKYIDGSYEQIREKIESALLEQVRGEDEDLTVYIRATFPEYVIARIENLSTGEYQYVRIPYELGEDDQVTFGDSEEVEIKEVVIPPAEDEGDPIDEEPADDGQDGNEEPTEPTDEEQPGSVQQSTGKSLLDKIREKFKKSGKAGRRISDANYQKLKMAKEVIEELLKIAEEERAQKGDQKVGQKGLGGINKAEKTVEKMIQEAITPLNDKINELMETLKSDDIGLLDTSQGDTIKGANKSVQRVENEAKDVDYKKLYDETVKQLESLKSKVPLSKRIAGQDGVGDMKKKMEPDRDAFGFKRTKK